MYGTVDLWSTLIWGALSDANLGPILALFILKNVFGMLGTDLGDGGMIFLNDLGDGSQLYLLSYLESVHAAAAEFLSSNEEAEFFRGYLTSELAAEMRVWWTERWEMDQDDTDAVALELAWILNKNMTGLPGAFLRQCPILQDLFQALWWSIRSHSQKTEAGFNLIDETDKNAKGLGWARLIARVLAKARLTRQWQAERRAVHEVKTPRKTPEQVDEDEEKGMVSKRPRLVYTAKA
jgi:hypothetical protein